MDPDQIVRAALFEKELGNQCHVRNNFIEAVVYYSQAIDKLVHVVNFFPHFEPHIRREFAVILSNRSASFSKIGNDPKALEDATGSINVDPSWHKGHWRKAQILKTLGALAPSLQCFLAGYNHSDADEDVKKNFLLEAVQLAIRVPDGVRDVARCRVTVHLWKKILPNLLDTHNYHCLRFIILGDSACPPLIQKSEKIENFCVGRFLLLCSDADLSSWGQKLAVDVLRRGTSIMYLDSPSDNYLQVALNVGLKTGCFDLLCLVINHRECPQQILQSQNQNGDTCLHHLAKCKLRNSPSRTSAVQELLKKQVDPHILNREGKRAINYTARNDPLFEILSQAMHKSGFHNLEGHQGMMRIKDEGNQQMKNGQTANAEESYTKAIEGLTKMKSHTHDLAVLYSNRAQARIKLNKLNAAEEDSRACLKTDPQWYKGYCRLAKVQTLKNNAAEALLQYVSAYERTNASDRKEKSEVIDEIVRVAHSHSGAALKPPKSRGSIRDWTGVVYDLASSGRWTDIDTIMKVAGGLGCTGTSIEISGLLHISFHDWRRWGEKLLITMLKSGTHVRHVSMSRGDTPLHAAVKTWSQTGSCELFNYLASTSPAHGMNIQDSNGDTVLHTATKLFSANPKAAQHIQIDRMVQQMVMERGVNAQLTNHAKKLAVEYLPKSHSAYQFLWSHVDSKVQEDMDRNNNTEKGGPRKSKTGTNKHCSECFEIWRYALFCIDHQHPEGAFRQLCIILEADHSTPGHGKMENIAINKIIELIEKRNDASLPEDLLSLKLSKLKLLTGRLYKLGDFPMTFRFLKKMKKYTPDGSECPADNLSLSQFLKSGHNLSSESQRLKDFEFLIRLGSSLSGLATDKMSPMKTALAQREYGAIEVLLRHKADPGELAIDDKSPLFVALDIALHKEKGTFAVLDLLMTMCKEYPYLAPSATDGNGNTLLHIVAKAQGSKIVLRAVQHLCTKNVNPNIRNKEGLTALQCLKKRDDRRTEFIRQAASSFSSPEPVKKTEKQSIPLHHKDVDMVESWENSDVELPVSSVQKTSTKTKKKEFTVEESRKRIEELLCNLVESSIESVQLKKQAQHHGKKIKMDKNASELNNAENNQIGNPAPEINPVEAVQENEEPGEEDIENGVIANNLEADRLFEELEWEVDCTSDVWKILQDKKLLPTKKRKIIAKIKMLASGEWRADLCKTVRGVPAEIKLYEAKLDKSARIVWELTVAFSPRRSNTAMTGLVSGNRSSIPFTGRIYTEIIRVWDIIFDHDNLARSIANVTKSISRGENCTVQKKLSGQSIDQWNLAQGDRRIPKVFMEAADEKVKPDMVRFCPPASAQETEYHIMKFYSFDTALISAVLQEVQGKVDFPFKVTDLEHDIIHLRPNPPAPILLLGRSGTGKTTCCLYRLWSMFQSYWLVAQEKGPLYSREVLFVENKTSDDPEEGAAEEEITIAGTCPADAAVSCPTDNTSEESCIEADHLHQVFITKNNVLCREVQKNFKELSHACRAAAEHVSVEDEVLPYRLQDISQVAYPLFITSRQFLLLLDASCPGESFFPRNEDGSLKREIAGWQDEDSPVDLNFSFEDDDESDSDEEELQEAGDAPENARLDPRREVTYEFFAQKMWPKMRKSFDVDYHPTLTWTEINSFIEGSLEALESEKGYLKKEEYNSLGKKRAPNFTGDRNKIYELFLKYRHFKSQNSMFDECDLVYNIYKRLQQNERLPWAIHEFYIDETQDFTQAELSLLIRCCQNPNRMFLTGDTAQSIMRGISFRFEDLKSLFFHARQCMKALGKTSAIQVPNRLYQLTHNYRSHAGILNLAASIVDLLTRFFPNSFDKLEKDQGLFEGPKPVLLESCSFSDLAVLLRGSKRKTSQIEFGAHQAVLVVDDAARESLPEELSLCLVLTIFESKGLEFDDILLYNFFKDSQAKKEWRVVTEHLNQLIEAQKTAQKTSNSSLREIKVDELLQEKNRPRPLQFDPDQHKVLNSELKHLYTAITRARVNVWIFDEDLDSRAPVFEYFKALDLVRTEKGDTEIDEGLSKDTFAGRISTQEEWVKRGDEFMQHRLYSVALKCYRMSGNEDRIKQALAHHIALEAERIQDNPKLLKEKYIFAAEKFIECQMLKEAAKCLWNAREFELAAEVYRQCHKAVLLYKKTGNWQKVSQAYERGLDYKNAISTLVNHGALELAIDVHQRYSNAIEQAKQMGNTSQMDLLEKNRPLLAHSLHDLCTQAAKMYHRDRKPNLMLATLEKIPHPEAQVNFLLKYNYVEEAARLLVRTGRETEAARSLYESGYFEQALQLVNDSTDDIFHAQILLALVHKQIRNGLPDAQLALDNAKKAFQIFEKRKKFVEVGEYYMCVYRITKDKEALKQAVGPFQQGHCMMGKVAVVNLFIENCENTDSSIPALRDCWHMIGGFEIIPEIVKNLSKPKKEVEKETASTTEKFWGLTEGNDNTKLVFNQALYPRILQCLPTKMDGKNEIPRIEAREIISKRLVKQFVKWFPILIKYLHHHFEINKQCPDFNMGIYCTRTECVHLHEVINSKHYDNLIKTCVYLMKLENAVSTFHQNCPVNVKEGLSSLAEPDFKSCEELYKILFPKGGHPTALNTYLLKDMQHYFDYSVQQRLHSFVKHNWSRFVKKNRVPHIDMFVKNYTVYQLIGERKGRIHLFTDAESAVEISRKKMSYCNLGFHVNFEQRVLKHVFRDYDESNHLLHTSCKVIASVKKCSDLLLFLARHAPDSVSLMPTFHHAMMMVELQMMTCFSLYLRLSPKDHKALLPQSYLFQVDFWNGMVRSPDKTLYEAIQSAYFGNLKDVKKELNERIRFLVKFMCGMLPGCGRFNVICDALQLKEEFVKSGEVERVLIFALVLLCNCSLAVQKVPCEELLRMAFCKVSVNQGATASAQHLVQIIQMVQNAETRFNIIEALEKLLCRRSEKLYQCKWRSRGNYDRIWYDELGNALEMAKDDVLNPLPVKAEGSADSSKGIQENDQTENENQTTEEPGKTEPVQTTPTEARIDEDVFPESEVDFQNALQEQKEQRAVRTILKAYREYRLRKQEQISKTVIAQVALPKYVDLDDVSIDETMCKICKVQFSRTDRSGEELATDDSEKPDKTVTRVEHEQSDMHKMKESCFLGFKSHYQDNVEDLLRKSERDMAAVHNSPQYRSASSRLGIPLKSLEDSIRDFIKTVNHVKNEASWEDTASVNIFRDREVKVTQCYKELQHQFQTLSAQQSKEKDSESSLVPQDEEAQIIMNTAQTDGAEGEHFRMTVVDKPTRRKKPRRGRGN